jgi:protein TonB
VNDSFDEAAFDGVTFDDPRVTTIESKARPEPRRVKPITVLPSKIKPATSDLVEPKTTDVPDQLADIEPNIATIELPSELVEPDTFIIVEVKPVPVGGWSGFYKTLAENIKYPRQAVAREISGKVFVEFVINREGKPSNFKILKGIGSGCDEEAIRILSLTKWVPGKQRGKPVIVRLVQPVHFALSH